MNSFAFAQLSGLLVQTAFAVYAVAFILWVIDLVTLRAYRSEQRFAAAQNKQRSHARSTGRLSTGRADTVTVLDRDDEVAARRDAPASPSAAAASANGGVAGPGAGQQTDRRLGAAPRRGLASLALALTGVAFLAHAGAMVFRSLATQRPPWGNMYEFAISGTALTILAFLLLAGRRPELRVLGTFVVGPVWLFMMIAQLLWYVPADELMPALQNTEWLFIHVSIAILGSGLLALGAAVTFLQLLKARSEKRLLAGLGGGRIMSALPSAQDLESLAFRINAVGFVMWTFTLIAGSIWAQYAWGRFWGWDPKEIWTFIVWVVYAAYLHARTTRGFRGSRAAWLSLVGFACVVFNFTGVNLILGGLHSYAGV